MSTERNGSAVRFGARLRHARESSRLSLQELADRSELTPGFLSRVERDETSPSVNSLVRICDALGIPIGDLFSSPTTTLVRPADRLQLHQLPASEEVVDTLLTPLTERNVTVLETVAAPGASGGDRLYTMPTSAEVCFVLEGSVEVQIEDHTFVLDAGCSLTFGASTPHTWRNPSRDTGARILWVLAPGLPDPLSEAVAPRGLLADSADS
jgi:transcriptional regulator with XRE-family HTH domain